MTALQEQDYGTIVELNNDIRLREAAIRSENPQFLWAKLIAEYRARAVRELKGEEQPTGVMDEIDFTHIRAEVNDLLIFVPARSRWTISEIRPDSDLSGNRFSRIFVTVVYAEREKSPKNADGALLRQAVLEFTVMAPSNRTVMFSNHVRAGDVLWSPEGSRARQHVETKVVAPELKHEVPQEPLQRSGSAPISHGTTPPKLVSKVPPEYSTEARKAKYQATVLLTATVGVDGVPRDIRVTYQAGFGLDERAIECVSKWRYMPALKDGEPVSSVVAVEVNFRLF